MLKKLVVIGATLALLGGGLAGCTAKERAKKYGGTDVIELEPGMKLEMVTWKGDNLWLQTRPMRLTDTAETHTFKEDSSYGILQGTILIVEKKK